MSSGPSSTVSHGRPVAAPPYPPSWIDALVAGVGRLPGPAWAATTWAASTLLVPIALWLITRLLGRLV